MKTVIQKDTCTSVFLGALFTIAKIWEKPKCPSTDKWIRRYHIYIVECYLIIEMKEILPFAIVLMDLESIVLYEMSKTNIARYHYMWNIKIKCGIK